MDDILQPIKAQKAEIAEYNERASYAQQLVDDVVLKKYLTRLEDKEILPLPEELKPGKGSIRLFKINKMVYEKDEYATDKFISMVGAMTYADNTIFLVLDGFKDHTDFYLGIRSDNPDRTAASVADTFKRAISGQFPGADITPAYESTDGTTSSQKRLFERISKAKSISTCVGLPTYKNDKTEYNNANFIQGIEKLAIAMQGREYTAIVIASCVDPQEVTKIRLGYETIYSELSAVATQQVAYSTNESLANSLTRTKGYSDSQSHTISSSDSTTISKAQTHSTGESKLNAAGKASKLISTISGPLTQVGSILLATGVGAPAGAVLMGAGAALSVGGVVAGMKEKTLTTNDATTTSKATTTQTGVSDANTHTEQFSDAEGNTSTIGSSKSFTLNIQNKHIQETLKLIDKQLERIEKSEAVGLWSSGSYFLSYEGDNSGAEIGASIFRSIMQGEQSGVEVSAINSWNSNTETNARKVKLLDEYVLAFAHPVFNYAPGAMTLPSSSLVNSKELAMMLGLPRKSVPGLPVVEHISLAKEVVRFSPLTESSKEFQLGQVFDQGIPKPQKVSLDANSLTKHVFVTGSTGCGKSETVYSLLFNVLETIPNVRFLIVEPAKGEYKDVFGDPKLVKVYGSNPLKSQLLKINPFKFPAKEIHVLEHIDRLVEIFNVCWPMYAAMPAVLKDAMLCSYEKCGWDLSESKNSYGRDLFPTFADLQNELINVINNSGYSEEVKSNYIGSLVTRVKSLTNGINGQIFSGNEIGDALLFDENVIVDLSRIGSQETKSLIMGILIMRLNEYRSSCAKEANSSLKHITVLEEAHNILKKCSQEQNMEGSNVVGKSVEMLSNSIAEMRTYGEGFIIVDQSPNAVDISAIRNTNTKVIMRLPEDGDRKVTGKSAAMKDEQIDEIAILPTGVGVIYQNDWEAPVLCKINKYDGKRHKYPSYPSNIQEEQGELLSIILKFLLSGRINSKDFIIDDVEDAVSRANIPTATKIDILLAIKEYMCSKSTTLWSNQSFARLSSLVSNLLTAKEDVIRCTKTEQDFETLTSALYRIIENKIPDIPEMYKKTIAQCLLRDYSLGSEMRLKTYSEWLKRQREKNA